MPTVTTAEMREKLGKPEFVYEIACAQLCGLGHYRMRGFVTIHEPAEFQTWMDEQVAAQLAREGENDRDLELVQRGSELAAAPSRAWRIVDRPAGWVQGSSPAAAAPIPNTFGVGIRARISSSTVGGHHLDAVLLAPALDRAGDHAAHEGGDALHALLGRGLPAQGGASRPGRTRRRRGPQAVDRGLEGARLVGAEGILGHHVAGHAVGAGAAAAAHGVELAGAAAAAEVVALADRR